MVAVFFMIYAAIGAGSGWALFTYAGIDLNLSIGAGAIITALIGQVHLFATRAGESSTLKTRIDTVESAQQDVRDRVDTVEARATAIETTVKQELTERRDALVSEMRQLETLIELQQFEMSAGYLALILSGTNKIILILPLQPA